MTSVFFDPALGGDGSTVTDDGNPLTGLGNGGHRVRFVPALAQVVSVSNFVLDKADITKDYAQKLGAEVEDGTYSAKEYAIGTTVPTGSAKFWAISAGNYQGDWDITTPYAAGESVSYLGKRYIAKVPNTGVEPVDGPTWLLITGIPAPAGEEGKFIQSVNGEAVYTSAGGYRGEYNALTQYYAGETVSFNGEDFRAKTDNLGIEPVDGLNWLEFPNSDKVFSYLNQVGDAVVLPEDLTSDAIIVVSGESSAGVTLPNVSNIAKGRRVIVKNLNEKDFITLKNNANEVLTFIKPESYVSVWLHENLTPTGVWGFEEDGSELNVSDEIEISNEIFDSSVSGIVYDNSYRSRSIAIFSLTDAAQLIKIRGIHYLQLIRVESGNNPATIGERVLVDVPFTRFDMVALSETKAIMFYTRNSQVSASRVITKNGDVLSVGPEIVFQDFDPPSASNTSICRLTETTFFVSVSGATPRFFCAVLTLNPDDSITTGVVSTETLLGGVRTQSVMSSVGLSADLLAFIYDDGAQTNIRTLSITGTGALATLTANTVVQLSSITGGNITSICALSPNTILTSVSTLTILVTVSGTTLSVRDTRSFGGAVASVSALSSTKAIAFGFNASSNAGVKRITVAATTHTASDFTSVYSPLFFMGHGEVLAAPHTANPVSENKGLYASGNNANALAYSVQGSVVVEQDDVANLVFRRNGVNLTPNTRNSSSGSSTSTGILFKNIFKPTENREVLLLLENGTLDVNAATSTLAAYIYDDTTPTKTLIKKQEVFTASLPYGALTTRVGQLVFYATTTANTASYNAINDSISVIGSLGNFTDVPPVVLSESNYVAAYRNISNNLAVTVYNSITNTSVASLVIPTPNVNAAQSLFKFSSTKIGVIARVSLVSSNLRVLTFYGTTLVESSNINIGFNCKTAVGISENRFVSLSESGVTIYDINLGIVDSRTFLEKFNSRPLANEQWSIVPMGSNRYFSLIKHENGHSYFTFTINGNSIDDFNGDVFDLKQQLYGSQTINTAVVAQSKPDYLPDLPNETLSFSEGLGGNIAKIGRLKFSDGAKI